MKFNRQKDLSAFLNVQGRPSIDQSCLLALCFLSSFDKPKCTYTVPQIARFTGLSVRTVYRALASLEKSGAISRESSSRYSACTLNMPRPEKTPLQVIPNVSDQWSNHFRRDAGIWSVSSEWALRSAPAALVAAYEQQNSALGMKRIPVSPDLFAARA
jgi:hypothetical protein